MTARVDGLRSRRGKLLTALVVTAALLVGATGVHAAQTWTSGTVTSGSEEYKIFSTKRYPTMPVYFQQTGSSPTAAMRYRLADCFSAVALTGYKTLGNGQGYTWSTQPPCFRIMARRAQPADTNGWWVPGSGNTTFNLYIRW